MVLASYGLVYSEATVYTCCETDTDGTLPSAAVRCVQRLGVAARTERLPDLANLLLLTAHTTPIVFLNLAPIMGFAVIHAVIVEKIELLQEQITIIDPAYPPAGRRTWALGQFQIGWRLARQQTIVIEPPM